MRIFCGHMNLTEILRKKQWSQRFCGHMNLTLCDGPYLIGWTCQWMCDGPIELYK